jgi:hydroxyethylthiazole kinase-like uncharacterized protein yjeF
MEESENALILDESVDVREMRAIEMNSEYIGVSRLQLMENAGAGVARAVTRRFDAKSDVVLVCGLGGNGGDGFVASRHLAGLGYTVKVILLGRHENIRSEEALVNWNALRNMGATVKIHEVHDSAEIVPLKADVIVDALIGTGVSGALSASYREMVKAINGSRGFKISVDMPTGLESDTGATRGEAVKADVTLTFHRPKTGLKKAEGYTGALEVCPIGVPPEAELYAGPGDAYLAHRRREPDSHKGDFGRLLIIGGSETYSGAPALAGLGAYAVGVDLVYVAAPESAASIIAGFSPSLITVKLKGSRFSMKNVEQISPLLDRVDAIAIGPGLGLHEGTVEAVNSIVETVEGRGLPLLLDADALKAYAGERRKLGGRAILTPHQAEFKVLTGKEVSGTLDERGEVVEKWASRLGATILLKGNVDVVSDGVLTRFNHTGNPGMTVGGTGDVLSGVSAAFLSMGVGAFEAAVAGAFINGAAGDAAFFEKGYHLLPEDVVNKVPTVIEDAIGGRMRRAD